MLSWRRIASITASTPAHSSGAGGGRLIAPSIAASGSIAVPPPKNLLLRALGPADYALLEAHLEPIMLAVKAPLFDPHKPIERVYFLEDGIASIVSEHETGRPVEIGI